MTKEEATKLLAEKVAQFEALLTECEAFADEHELTFSIYPSYGMGGHYRGGEPNEYDGDTCWHPSSQSC